MIYPISFSFPTDLVRPLTEKKKKYSKIVPGEPYSFTDPEKYLDEYAESQYAITMKKAGFDCMRHLEILAAGSVPIFKEPETIPERTMTHYNKELFLKGEAATSEEWREHFEKHLTTKAMANYMMKTIGDPKVERVLFIDDALPGYIDYLSLFIAAGMKEIHGNKLDLLFELPYLYKDFTGSLDHHHGKGFNCTKFLEPSMKTKRDRNEIARSLYAKEYDLVIFGSVFRGNNLKHLQQILNSGFDKEKVVVCTGEDLNLSQLREKAGQLVQNLEDNFHFFVREIDT
jgi:hypothetical protein